jgi:VanZ family protein
MRRLLYTKGQACLAAALWGSLAAIVILSLVPGDARPHTGAPGEFEHFIAYLAAGFLIVARYPSLRLRLGFWAATAALSFLLEFFQQFVPGRMPDQFDALASSSGLTLGVFLGGALLIRS